MKIVFVLLFGLVSVENLQSACVPGEERDAKDEAHGVADMPFVSLGKRLNLEVSKIVPGTDGPPREREKFLQLIDEGNVDALREFVIKNSSQLSLQSYTSKYMQYDPLYRAISAGHENVVNFLLDEVAADTDQPRRLGYNSRLNNVCSHVESVVCLRPVYFAVLLGQYRIAQNFIERGACIMGETAPKWERAKRKAELQISLLSCLAQYLDLAGIQFVVEEAKIDINRLGADGYCALNFMCACPGLTERTAQVVSYLLSRPEVDVNCVTDKGYPPLQLAVGHNNVELVRLLLTRKDIDLESVGDSLLLTPLQLACKSGFTRVAHALLGAGADMFAQDGNGDTPYTLAMQENKTSIRNLLKFWASAQKQDLYVQSSNAKMTVLWAACDFGDTILVKQLLAQSSAYLEQQCHGQTPLFVACGRDHAQIAEALLIAGAVVDAKGLRHGMTPLHIAAQKGSFSTVELLLQYGADIYARTNRGTIALDIAGSCPRTFERNDAPPADGVRLLLRGAMAMRMALEAGRLCYVQVEHPSTNRSMPVGEHVAHDEDVG